jgi:arylsulfatase A
LNRRLFAFTIPLWLIAFGQLAAADVEQSDRPNVIVIVTDDQGAGDAGCYGARDLETPAIDGLAACGIRFTQFYAGAPVCSPSRAALLTGRYPLNAGLIGNASSQPGGEGLPASQITMAEMFRAAGYATGHFGKWHLGYTPATMPNGQGFDESFGHMGGCIDNFSHFFYWQGPNRHDLFQNGQETHRPGRFFGDLMVEEASTFIKRHRTRPFFLYFAMNMPHYPYQGDAKWLDRYKHVPYPRNLYNAFLSSCDARIGMLLAQIDESGLRDRTIVVFQSDNGHSLEERAHFGGGSAGPYRGSKFSLLEGGIRLPGIIAWPGILPQGEVRDQMVHSCDWMPTLGELCGVKVPRDDLDGKSLVAVLRSSTMPSPHETLHWLTGAGKDPQWAIRQGDWKLIGNLQSALDETLTADDRTLFLSNLALDPREASNLAKQRPEIVERLAQAHATWVQCCAVATKNSSSRDEAGNEK